MRQHLSSLILAAFFVFGMLITGNIHMAGEVPAPKVYLNHFFLNIDSSTYEDIVESVFIKNEFAHFEKRTTVVGEGESYSGAYVYGENTYFEFFEMSDSPDSMPAGLTSGMAFGVDKKDEIKIIQKKLKSYKNAFLAPRTRELDGTQIPWFYASGVFYGDTARDIMTWVMEYHENFLKKWHPDLDPSTPGIRRKDILQRYAAKIAKPDLPKQKILKDVIQINLDLNKTDLEILKGELAVFEYAFTQEKNELLCSGPDVKFIITSIENGKGKISGIKMSCHPHRHKEKTFRFGEKSRLVLHSDNTATWVF
jgi:hypothetical protein